MSVSLTPNASTSTNATSTQAGGTSPGGKTGTPVANQITRIDAITAAANLISTTVPQYIFGGGHAAATLSNPDMGGYDCSAAVAAVLGAAGLYPLGSSVPADDGLFSQLMSNGLLPGEGTGNPSVTVWDLPTHHIFMVINGRTFSYSTAGRTGWSDHSTAGFTPGHYDATTLNQLVSSSLPAGAAAPGGTSGGSGGGSIASAFATFLELPSVFASAEAMAFTGKRSFIADMPLFPFIEQLSQASMRNFMSMPNGNFFAFFPDYFGLYGRKYYWEIRDIEIIDGHIDLMDDPLVTHVAVAGDVTQYHHEVDIFDLAKTSGIFTIFEALASGFLGSLRNRASAQQTLPHLGKGGNKKKNIVATADDKQAALSFLQRYGARPLVEKIPAIRSPFFELFYAFQKFMLLWAKQFQTVFEITFMPELFPGGLVALPDHHVQVYIEEVDHNFDYEHGFTTTITVSSPAVMDSTTRSNVSDGLAYGAGNATSKAAKTTQALK